MFRILVLVLCPVIFQSKVISAIQTNEPNHDKNSSAKIHEVQIQNRGKRQYYSCSQGNFTYLSQEPCDKQCSNGGTRLGTGCTMDFQCQLMWGPETTCISNCCCSRLRFPTTQRPFFDPNSSPINNLTFSLIVCFILFCFYQ